MEVEIKSGTQIDFGTGNKFGDVVIGDVGGANK